MCRSLGAAGVCPLFSYLFKIRLLQHRYNPYMISNRNINIMAYYFTNPYEQPYIAAKQELDQRVKELETLHQRIVWLKGSIAALEPLVNANSAPPRTGTLSDIL